MKFSFTLTSCCSLLTLQRIFILSLTTYTISISYNIGWILLTFLGVFGVHRMYMGKWLTGILYLLTGGLFFIGVLYDFWTLNSQISERNRADQLS